MNTTLERIQTLIDEVQSDISPLSYEKELRWAGCDLQDAKHIIRDEEHDGEISKTSLRKVNKMIKSAYSHLEEYYDGEDLMIENCLGMLKEAGGLSEEPVDILRITDKEIIFSEPIVKYATHEEMQELWEICQRIGKRFKEENSSN